MIVRLLALAVLAPAAAAPAPADARGCFDLEHVPPVDGGTTYYIRADGGMPEQCDGRGNAAYPGEGLLRRCAWKHPFLAFPPGGGAARIAGGDRVVIGPGTWRMGAGAPGAELCDPERGADCVMAPVPSGSPGKPTRIVGAPAAGGAPPVLRGAGRPYAVVNLARTSHALLACLEIADQAEGPGEAAAAGILAFDSQEVTLRALDVHGLGAGIVAGRLRDWTVEDVRLAGNRGAGWLGDLGEPSADRGSLRFRRFTIEDNGEGLRAGITAGDWRFEDGRVSGNRGAGLDLSRHDGDGGVVLERVRVTGNGGPQLAVRGALLARNLVAAGRAGDVLRLEPLPGRAQLLVSSTIAGRDGNLLSVVLPVVAPGDPLRAGLPRDVCARLAPMRAVDTVWLGGGATALYYRECGGLEGAGPAFDNRAGVVWLVKDYGLPTEGACPPASGNLCVDPRLDGELRPRAGSPVVDSGEAGPEVPAVDVDGVRRPQGKGVDRGAYER